MKFIIQIILAFLIIISMTVFYKKYFMKENSQKNIKFLKDITTEKTEANENNSIKNLKYEINLDQNKRYIIKANLSELIYVEQVEFVKMQKVKANLFDENNYTLTISSDNALYNSSNNNTKFEDNVLIDYMNNKIYSNKLDLDFRNNIIKIYDEVLYFGANGNVKSDNISINLLTKKIDIFMNRENDKVIVNNK